MAACKQTGGKTERIPAFPRLFESAATLVHAFVASRIDYCNVMLAGAPKIMTDKLQRVLNAAARVISGTRKFDRGSSAVRHSELYWLDIPEWIIYKLGVMTYGWQHGTAPQYLADCCTPVSDVPARHLRSSSHHLVVLRHRLSTYGRRAFSVAGKCMQGKHPEEGGIGGEIAGSQTDKHNKLPCVNHSHLITK